MLPNLVPPETCPIRRDAHILAITGPRRAAVRLPASGTRAVLIGAKYHIIAEGNRMACVNQAAIGTIVDAEQVPIADRCRRPACAKHFNTADKKTP
jgi:hypothetical protein